jgi:D-alanine-D-alanine ligase
MKIPFVVRTNAHKAPFFKIDKHIEIVASSNHRLNSMSRNSQRNVLAVLEKHYTRVNITLVDDMAGLDRLVAKKPELVILGVKLILLEPAMGYDDSTKVWLANHLDTHGITYTGSDAAALSLALNKPGAKRDVLSAGLQSSAYFISSIKQPIFSHSLRYPLFVKPTNRSDSKGVDAMSVVNTQTELERKIIAIHTECESDALVEEYLSGREFSVAVIRQAGSDKLQAMPVEISTPADTNGNSFLSEVVKNANTEQVLAVTDSALKQALSVLAIGVFAAIGSRDCGRIDMRLNDSGVPHFIEANLMPGLSDHGYLARCFALNQSTSYEDMILSITDLGLQRSHKTRPRTIPFPENTITSSLTTPGAVLS